MGADASIQQAMASQRAAMESDVMRPPYTQPYGAMAYATQPGFQGAPVAGLQIPTYASSDSCGGYGAPPRMTPAAQMYGLQQQRMAQIQAQQQSQQAQAQAMKAGAACLKGKKGKALKRLMMGDSGGVDCSKKMMWTNLIWAIVVLIVIVLLIVAVVYVVRANKTSSALASTLQSPVIGV
jgi:hypothetical protein